MTSISATCQPTASLSLRNPIAFSDPGLNSYPIATGLSRPRHLLIDSANNILVIDAGRGIISLTDSSTCGGFEQRTVVEDESLNTGIAMHETTLYASSEDELFAWTWDPSTFAASNRRSLVSGMGGSSHGTRTIALEPGPNPSYVIMGRGSDGNLDSFSDAQNRSQIRRFPLDNSATTPIDWSQGEVIARGIRNAVGIAHSPDARSLWIVENSADNLRLPTGEDVSNDNPGEDVNQIDLSQSARNFGYPTCFTVHSPSAFPSPRTVGSQFSIDASVSDADCDANSAAARLALPAHYAPLDIRFLTSANTSFGTSWVNSALVASHGSWNADPPVGYSLLRVPFDSSTNEPIATVDNPQGYETIFAPPDISACPGGCFRPVGIAVERARAGDNGVFVTSDSTGEIVRVYRGSALPVRSGASKDAAAMILLVGGLAVHLLA